MITNGPGKENENEKERDAPSGTPLPAGQSSDPAAESAPARLPPLTEEQRQGLHSLPIRRVPIRPRQSHIPIKTGNKFGPAIEFQHLGMLVSEHDIKVFKPQIWPLRLYQTERKAQSFIAYDELFAGTKLAFGVQGVSNLLAGGTAPAERIPLAKTFSSLKIIATIRGGRVEISAVDEGSWRLYGGRGVVRRGQKLAHIDNRWINPEQPL